MANIITERSLEAGLVIVGGGIAGVSVALAAARHGADCILIQDRPMLGGNASSEIRMGITGADGDNCKETGILEELQLMNYHFNPLLRYTLWDDVLLSAVLREKNIRLLLNTSVYQVDCVNSMIESVKCWNGHEYCRYQIKGKLFADCSGDSILRLSGAEFRIGREGRSEFGEDMAPDTSDHYTMGSSLLFQLRNNSGHRSFKASKWVHQFTDATIPPFRNLLPKENNFWWLEYGGMLDTVADAGEIQLELKKIAYGVWDYLKNHPDGDCRNYELDWLGSLPGKRESARYVGDHILTQNDILDAVDFPDVIGHGGWPLDDHAPAAFYHPGAPNRCRETPSPYGIPYRALYSKNIDNLFFAGRNISATHMAFSSTRVMGTCSVLGQAVGTAAAMALAYRETPRGIYERHIPELQARLQEDDQLIPGIERRVSAVTLEANASHEDLRNGIDRKWGSADNGVYLAPGEEAGYSWENERILCGARLVFDTDLQFKGKRQPKHEGGTDYVAMPPMLAKGFRIEVKNGDTWQAVFADSDNYLRLRKIEWKPISADAVRLVVESTHGAERAHIFSFEVIS